VAGPVGRCAIELIDARAIVYDAILGRMKVYGGGPQAAVRFFRISLIGGKRQSEFALTRDVIGIEIASACFDDCFRPHCRSAIRNAVGTSFAMTGPALILNSKLLAKAFTQVSFTSERYEMAVATGSRLGLLDSASSNGQWADWQGVVDRFLEAVDPQQREVVSLALADPYGAGWGLRLWVSSIVWGSAIMPVKIPVSVIEVYLADADVIPLHDCCSCGLAVPVRPNQCNGVMGEPEKIYFPLCPSCDSPTGWYLCRSY
jgi:hypothetical protein